SLDLLSKLAVPKETLVSQAMIQNNVHQIDLLIRKTVGLYFKQSKFKHKDTLLSNKKIILQNICSKINNESLDLENVKEIEILINLEVENMMD
ncbi:MAG: hypothetical protein MHPSP_000518, partial [Paramarteilia canceri]